MLTLVLVYLEVLDSVPSLPHIGQLLDSVDFSVGVS